MVKTCARHAQGLGCLLCKLSEMHEVLQAIWQGWSSPDTGSPDRACPCMKKQELSDAGSSGPLMRYRQAVDRHQETRCWLVLQFLIKHRKSVPAARPAHFRISQMQARGADCYHGLLADQEVLRPADPEAYHAGGGHCCQPPEWPQPDQPADPSWPVYGERTRPWRSPSACAPSPVKPVPPSAPHHLLPHMHPQSPCICPAHCQMLCS